MARFGQKPTHGLKVKSNIKAGAPEAKPLTFPYRECSKYGCRFPEDTRLCTKKLVRILT